MAIFIDQKDLISYVALTCMKIQKLKILFVTKGERGSKKIFC